MGPSDAVSVTFTTDSSIQYEGFLANVTFQDASNFNGILTGQSVEITSPIPTQNPGKSKISLIKCNSLVLI